MLPRGKIAILSATKNGAALTFEEHLRKGVEALGAPARALEPGECRTPQESPCGLCSAMTLDYTLERELKQRALSAFWTEHVPSVPVDPLVGSPRGRAYRAVSKRKLYRTPGGPRLGLVGSAERPAPAGIPVVRCAIEPIEHAGIYAHHDRALRAPWCAPLSESLSYVVLKGDGRSTSIIWNVRSTAPDVVRAANTLSKSLTRKFGDGIAGVFLYRGDDAGRYYLGTRDPAGRQEVRKLFGRSDIAVRVAGRLLRFPPLSFSQVNTSMLDLFVSGAGELLKPGKSETLLDLYCGYGLFALSLGGLARRVIGVEASRVSVAAARDNARRLGMKECRFTVADIAGETLPAVMASLGGPTVAILDPPRNGTSGGVIEALAGAGPARVLHVFCNSALILPDLERWRRHDYFPARVRAFDMFPGTPELETMVLLERRRQGI